MIQSRKWLLLNAVEAWLHHYGNVNTPIVAQYKKLQVELHDAYMLTLHKDVVVDEEPTPTPTPRTRSTKSK